MKTNKKIRLTKVFPVFAALLLLFGCSLDETIYDTPTPKGVLKEATDVPVVLTGVYGIMTTPIFNPSIWVPMRAGMEVNYYGAGNQEASFQYDQSSLGFLQIWQLGYRTIYNANALLEEMEGITFNSPAVKNRYVGETKFLRSFNYFNLVRFFGKLPITLKASKSDQDFNVPRSSVEEVYKVIFDDFLEAAKYCPKVSKMSATERGRVTKGAAHALLAEAYLTYANWLELNNKAGEAPAYYRLAKQYADSVIQEPGYSLIPKYADLFNIAKENDAYKEVIFGIQATVIAAGGNGSPFATNFAPANMFNVCGMTSNNGMSSASYGIAPWVYDQYTSGDYRGADGTIDFRMGNTMLPTRYRDDKASAGGTYTEIATYPQVGTGVSSSRFFPCTMKYVDPNGNNNTNNGNDLFYIRLAEIYLIKAEALNELNGPTQEAFDAINVVRARARNSVTPASLVPRNMILADAPTKEDLRMKIYDERTVETYAESRNFYDVRRMRCKDNTRTMLQYIVEDIYPTLKVDGAYQALAYNTATEKWEGSRINVQQVPVNGWDNKWLLWPIPYTEYQLNPGMGNDFNPGW